MVSEKMEIAWRYVKDKLFYPGTGLIYDRAFHKPEDLPSSDETARSWPNPCGYGTAMEDSMISGGTMLDTCVCRYEAEKSKEAAEFGHLLINGILKCASAAKSKGFLPRSLSPSDGISHYIDSSRDQYTMFVFGSHRWMNSSLCTRAERDEISAALTGFARRAEIGMRPENNMDMLREDGGPTLVTQLWGSKMGNHEFCRLPMFYIAAWEADGDEHWLKQYSAVREEAFSRSLPMTSYWHLYTLHQMMAALTVCRDADPDPVWKDKYNCLMNTVAEYAARQISIIRLPFEENRSYLNKPYLSFRALPTEQRELGNDIYGDLPNEKICNPDSDAYFWTQDIADIMITSGMAPECDPPEDAQALFYEAFNSIDFNCHTLSLPIYFLEAYWRHQQRMPHPDQKKCDSAFSDEV